MGFSRQEHWSGLPFPSPMHESEKSKVKSLSRVRLLATPWTAAYHDPPSMGFSRQEYWSGVPLPSPSVVIFSHDREWGGRSRHSGRQTGFGNQGEIYTRRCQVKRRWSWLDPSRMEKKLFWKMPGEVRGKSGKGKNTRLGKPFGDCIDDACLKIICWPNISIM